jgi:hypothetical protein
MIHKTLKSAIKVSLFPKLQGLPSTIKFRFFYLFQSSIIYTKMVGYFMLYHSLNLGSNLSITTASEFNRLLKYSYLIWWYQPIGAGTLCQWHAFIEAKQSMAAVELCSR